MPFSARQGEGVGENMRQSSRGKCGDLLRSTDTELQSEIAGIIPLRVGVLRRNFENSELLENRVRYRAREGKIATVKRGEINMASCRDLRMYIVCELAVRKAALADLGLIHCSKIPGLSAYSANVLSSDP